MKKSKHLSLPLLAVWASSVSAEACSVCMGANGSAIGEAANGAIFVMLGVLGSVLGLIVLAGYSVVKRGQLPLPPHAELARSMSNSEAH
jgi:hypothetical protein